MRLKSHRRLASTPVGLCPEQESCVLLPHVLISWGPSWGHLFLLFKLSRLSGCFLVVTSPHCANTQLSEESPTPWGGFKLSPGGLKQPWFLGLPPSSGAVPGETGGARSLGKVGNNMVMTR